MRAYDFSPLFRSTVGFDRMTRALDAALQANESAGGYPPYNIEKLGDDRYQVVLAVAGFGPADLEIVSHDGTITIRGKVAQGDDEGRTFLHRGIAGRAFERTFQLADYIRVSAASLENGLLTLSLVREVPEALKPRRIEIDAVGSKQIEHREAA